jgi:hypothetical protein
MRVFIAASLLALACAKAPSRFAIGVLTPADPRDEAAALRLGLESAAEAPTGAAQESAAGADGTMADLSRLRFLGSRAAVSGKSGIFFALPEPPPGRAVSDYAEEWQALVREARELAAIRGLIESGSQEPAPIALPAGVLGRGWRRHGRLTVVLVNDSGSPAPIPAEPLDRYRALFEARSDARELLEVCPGAGLCLPAGRALWLEGRPE